MISFGFACGYSDLATIDVMFYKPSCYLCIGTTGDVVFENTAGDAQFFKNAIANNIYPLAARRILTSGTVNGTVRTTTATNIVYCSTNTP